MAKRPLFPHQEDALAYCRKFQNPALFMEMRLGKTLVVIRALLEREAQRVLIAGPLTALTGWQEELDSEGERHVLLHGQAPERREWMAAKLPMRWKLINWEGLRITPGILKQPWDAVVADESVYIKNPSAQLTKVCLRGFKRAKSKVIMSGLPAPETPLEYIPQFLFLDGEFLGYTDYWKARVGLFRQAFHDWVAKPEARVRIKKFLHERAFILSRKDAGLPCVKLYEKLTVEMTPPQKKAYQTVERDFALPEYMGGNLTKWSPVNFTWLREIAGGFINGVNVSRKKIDALMELLTGNLRGQQVVVFFAFNEDLHGVHAFLRKQRISSVILTGDNTPKERLLARQAFAAGKAQVFLAQIKAVRYGFDLSAADTAIFYSNDPGHDARAQAEERIQHPAKETPLLYIDLVTKDTVDEDILLSLKGKKNESKFFQGKFLSKLKMKYSRR